MSGHSKFANIKHKKEKNDAKKGKIFTVIGRELVMAGNCSCCKGRRTGSGEQFQACTGYRESKG